MAWKINGTPDTLTVANWETKITDLTALDFNVFLAHGIQNGTLDFWCRYNNNSNNVYAQRVSVDGGTDSTAINLAQADVGMGNFSNDQFVIQYMMSILGDEKLIISFSTRANTTGAANAPARKEAVFKFVPSPDAEITEVTFFDSVGSGTDMAINSNLSALGTD